MERSKEIEVAIQVLDHGRGLPLPQYETHEAAGMDLRAAVGEKNPITLLPGTWSLIPTGIAVAIPAGWEGQIRPRSGLALKKGVTVLNAPGTIDADYRGEVGVILIHHGHDPFVVQRGDRIAQLLFAPVTRGRWHAVDQLDQTRRGQDGFGSTGG